MADVNRGNRPLSPHLLIYRPQITAISSIFVRITGNALLGTAILIVAWFATLAFDDDAFRWVNAVLTSWFGLILLALSAWAMWYHLLGGLRHLIWDTGRGLELRTAEIMGWGMFIGSFVLTIITFILV